MQTTSLVEFNDEATRFAASLTPAAEATVVALSGDLGAGKTTFTQALARHFGIAEQVSSPTFVIEKIYSIEGGPPAGGFTRLVHIDAYRLKGSHELEALGWAELVHNPENLVLIEWPERVAELIPSSAHRIALTFIDEHTREISYGEKSN